MEFKDLGTTFSLYKTYKKIRINNPLIKALLSINDEKDEVVNIFPHAERKINDTRGKGTTAEGLDYNKVDGDHVIDM